MALHILCLMRPTLTVANQSEVGAISLTLASVTVVAIGARVRLEAAVTFATMKLAADEQTSNAARYHKFK